MQPGRVREHQVYCLVLVTGKLCGPCSRQQATRTHLINVGCAAGGVGCQPLAAAAEGHALDDCWGDAAQQLEDVDSGGQGHALAAGAGGADPAGQDGGGSTSLVGQAVTPAKLPGTWTGGLQGCKYMWGTSCKLNCGAEGCKLKRLQARREVPGPARGNGIDCSAGDSSATDG